ncbi:MAG: hypothetical protein LBQ79_01125, partial [Deltaproteobacteria bacterium]|nr:hypothetical protein [Deltaproteobacteria bacterium]
KPGNPEKSCILDRTLTRLQEEKGGRRDRRRSPSESLTDGTQIPTGNLAPAGHPRSGSSRAQK